MKNRFAPLATLLAAIFAYCSFALFYLNSQERLEQPAITEPVPAGMDPSQLQSIVVNKRKMSETEMQEFTNLVGDILFKIESREANIVKAFSLCGITDQSEIDLLTTTIDRLSQHVDPSIEALSYIILQPEPRKQKTTSVELHKGNSTIQFQIERFGVKIERPMAFVTHSWVEDGKLISQRYLFERNLNGWKQSRSNNPKSTIPDQH